MPWAPEEAAVAQLAGILAATLDGRDRTRQKSAEVSLKQIKKDPDVDNYLTYLTITPTPPAGLSAEAYTPARSAACLLLKNHVRASWKSQSDANKDYIKSHILHGLRDPWATLRSYVGIVITEIVRQGGILGWTQVLNELVTLIQGNESPAVQDGAMGALLKICEDNRKALNKSYGGTKPMDVLVPKLVDFSASPTAKVRSQALEALNSLVGDNPPEAVQMNAENILQALTQRASDSDENVRRYVCRLFTSLTTNFPDLMLPHFGEIIRYVLTQQSTDPNSDSTLALDAAEFFYQNCETPELKDYFEQYLSEIVPVLLVSMIYNEDAQARLEAEAEEDAEQDDREQDIKPQFATSKTDKGKAAAVNGGAAPGYAYDGEDSDGEIDEDGEEDPEDEWNLRKCSAATLDSFSAVYQGKIFEVALPYLKDNLSNSRWPNREAAVLTLGAISTGCMDVVMPSLPELVPYLLTLLDDPTPVVRQITCWTLGRYSSWAAQLDEAGKKRFFEPIMEGLLGHMLDKNKKVQKAAISAFASLEDGAKENLIPYGLVIAKQFSNCFDRYKDQNMYFLYDCVQTLSECLGQEMAEPSMVDALMPSMIKRWHLVPDESREMFPLLECLSYLAAAMGTSFQPFAQPLFDRCVRVIHKNLDESQKAAGRSAYEQPDQDFLVTSLDLLSAIIQALEEQLATELVKSSSTSIFELLAYCMRNASNDVRQSAYALLGDCAINVSSLVQPYLEPLLKIVILQLDLDLAKTDRETVYRVINNACWSAGELAMRSGEALAPFVDPLLEKLGVIMFKPNVLASLHENAAVAIGRLGIGHASKLAPHLGQLAPTFLTVMNSVAWTDEKQHALQGFTNVVALNPQGLEQCLMHYLGEVGTGLLQNVPPPTGFKEILDQYQAMIGDFAGYIGHLPAPQAQALRQTFSIQ